MAHKTSTPSRPLSLRQFIRYLGESAVTFSVSVVFEQQPVLKLDPPLVDSVSSDLAHALEDLVGIEFCMEILGDSTIICEPQPNGDLRVHCNEMVGWMLDCMTGTHQILSELVEQAGINFTAPGSPNGLGELCSWPPEVTASVAIGPNGVISSNWEELLVCDTTGSERPLTAIQEAQLKQFIEESIFSKIPQELGFDECDFYADFGIGQPRLDVGECRQVWDQSIIASSLDNVGKYSINLTPQVYRE
jgi:hypothetical protein